MTSICLHDPPGDVFTSLFWVGLGHHRSHGPGVRLSVRAGAVQVAPLAPPADREAAHHLGIQNPLPGCSVPSGGG